ncbi:hypothetical protein [Streptococcus mitis]|uniref:Phage protein n=1 Tax=Streptococcus mitis TaxID=28037 RepID=A0A1X1K5L6_STRMT|nr:hypothetical protein [Streptococcus mitis]ORO94746.1 hypothetical protein B7698_05740 [Streptococcus mitis]
MTVTTGKMDTNKITAGDIKAVNLLKYLKKKEEIKEKEKILRIPILPTEIAEMLEEAKKDGMSLVDAIVCCHLDLADFFDKEGQEAFARAWLDGYMTGEDFDD